MAGRSASRGALAPVDELARDRALAGSSELTRGRRANSASGSRSSDTSSRARHSSRAHPSRPRRPAPLQGVAELEEVQDVLAGVLDLLGAERAASQRVKLALLRRRTPSGLVQQRLVAQLRAQAGEAGGDLRVEEVPHLGPPARGAAARRPGGRRA